MPGDDANTMTGAAGGAAGALRGGAGLRRAGVGTRDLIGGWAAGGAADWAAGGAAGGAATGAAAVPLAVGGGAVAGVSAVACGGNVVSTGVAMVVGGIDGCTLAWKDELGPVRWASDRVMPAPPRAMSAAAAMAPARLLRAPSWRERLCARCREFRRRNNSGRRRPVDDPGSFGHRGLRRLGIEIVRGDDVSHRGHPGSCGRLVQLRTVGSPLARCRRVRADGVNSGLVIGCPPQRQVAPAGGRRRGDVDRWLVDRGGRLDTFVPKQRRFDCFGGCSVVSGRRVVSGFGRSGRPVGSGGRGGGVGEEGSLGLGPAWVFANAIGPTAGTANPQLTRLSRVRCRLGRRERNQLRSEAAGAIGRFPAVLPDGRGGPRCSFGLWLAVPGLLKRRHVPQRRPIGRAPILVVDQADVVRIRELPKPIRRIALLTDVPVPRAHGLSLGPGAPARSAYLGYPILPGNPGATMMSLLFLNRYRCEVRSYNVVPPTVVEEKLFCTHELIWLDVEPAVVGPAAPPRPAMK